MESKNKLRAEKKKAPMIYMGVVLSLCLLFFMMYGTYNYMQYAAKNELTELNMEQFIASLNDLFSSDGFYLPFSSGLLLEILKWQVTKLWWVYLCAAAAVFVVATSNNKDDFKGMEHGSAQWATKQNRKLFEDNSGIPCGDNFYVTVNNPNHKYYSSHNLNEIVIGGSGAGKSFRKIKPDIMQMTGSYVVTDPSGELYRDCSKFLKKNGYNVKVLNLTDINLSDSYNPFYYMTSEQDVLNIADLFMKNSAGEGEKEDFWTGAAQDLLVAIMLYLFKTDGELKSFGRVIRLVNSIEYEDGKIDELCELARCLEAHSVKYPYDAASVNWKSIKGTPQETMGSIAKTLSTRLRLWAVEDVDMLTADDEMDFDNIGVHKTAIFLIIPAARQTYKAVANIFYSQLFERLMYIASLKYNNRLPLLVSCELDEFANIGRIPNFCETLAVVRKYNIRLCIVLQGLSQLKALYKDTFDGIIGNCSIFTFLGTNDQESKEYLSKKLGKVTVRTETRSHNRGNQGGGSDSESYSGRELLMPDEIPRALKKGKNGRCIVFVDEFNPFMLGKFDTLHHPLIGEVGSSFPKDAHNNTDITVIYADKHSARAEKYQKEMDERHALEKAAEEEAKKKQLEEKVTAEEAVNVEAADEWDKMEADVESFNTDEDDTLPERSPVLDTYNEFVTEDDEYEPI